jgi:cyanophycinase
MSNNKKPKGKLIIIGGHENRDGDPKILQEVAKEATRKKGGLIIVTVATQLPEEISQEYTEIFKKLGVKKIDVLDIREREQAKEPEYIQRLDEAAVVFFSGGDQLRLTSQIGDSLVFQRMREMFEKGYTLVGTSAGAAAMSETMLIGGPSDKSSEISTLSMAPGLGLIKDIVFDTHFAERGRMGRLLGVVAQNPRNLGIGIDEDTAIVVEGEEQFRVIGSGGVYVVDGADVSYSSLSEKHSQGIISIYDVKLHVLREGDRFNLIERRPVVVEPEGEPA